MELVSGPDLGGGFLFQLTAAPDGAETVYTVHAQEGGIDGGEAPAGSPAGLGFAEAVPPCPLGGRHCWHREFVVTDPDPLRIRFAYNRMRFVIGPMLRQRQPGSHVPFAAGLRETLARIAAPLNEAGVPWWVGGSAGLALLGAPVEPRDLDLATTRTGVHLMADALADALIEPEARTRWAGGPSRWAARAFVGTLRDGLRVEWAEPVAAPDPPGPAIEWSAARFEGLETVRVEGHSVPVAPPEVPLVAAVLADRADRVGSIAELYRSRPVHWALVDRLVEEAGGTVAVRATLRRRLDDALRAGPPSTGPAPS
jgi:Aminoglycoside-2''-adenylyltransferase